MKNCVLLVLISVFAATGFVSAASFQEEQMLNELGELFVKVNSQQIVVVSVGSTPMWSYFIPLRVGQVDRSSMACSGRFNSYWPGSKYFDAYLLNVAIADRNTVSFQMRGYKSLSAHSSRSGRAFKHGEKISMYSTNNFVECRDRQIGEILHANQDATLLLMEQGLTFDAVLDELNKERSQ